MMLYLFRFRDGSPPKINYHSFVSCFGKVYQKFKIRLLLRPITLSLTLNQLRSSPPNLQEGPHPINPTLGPLLFLGQYVCHSIPS